MGASRWERRNSLGPWAARTVARKLVIRPGSSLSLAQASIPFTSRNSLEYDRNIKMHRYIRKYKTAASTKPNYSGSFFEMTSRDAPPSAVTRRRVRASR